MGRTAGVAVLGAGLIGLDLIAKIQRSAWLDCRLVVGRDRQSVGLAQAAEMGFLTAEGGVSSLREFGTNVDVVFDASNADCHALHWPAVEAMGATLIDLTPTRQGMMIVPTVNSAHAVGRRHLNLISCGGQAAIPILHAITEQACVEYIEVVSTAASASAGRATRLNVDEYIDTTQTAIRDFTGATQVKVMAKSQPRPPCPAISGGDDGAHPRSPDRRRPQGRRHRRSSDPGIRSRVHRDLLRSQ